MDRTAAHSRRIKDKMVEKITINPENVRGYGNIVSPKLLRDFATYETELSQETDTVNGETKTVYMMEYDDTPKVITSISLVCSADETCLVGDELVLNASVDDIVCGQTITFYNGTTSLGTANTNIYGVATFRYTMTTTGEYTFKAKYSTYTSNEITITCNRQDSLINVDDG